jgi:hypothetical protein
MICPKCKRLVQAAVKCVVCGMLLLGAIFHCEPPHVHPDYRASWVMQQQLTVATSTSSSSAYETKI